MYLNLFMNVILRFKLVVKYRFLVIFVLCLSVLSIKTVFAQNKSEKVPFARGEELYYRIFFESVLTGQIDAGVARMMITKDNRQIGGNNTYHATLEGETIGAINFFWKVKDRFESFFDENTLLPYLFIRRASESGYIANEDITFDQQKRIAYYVNNKKKENSLVKLKSATHDILSSYYFARAIDLSEIKKPNGYFEVDFMLSDSVYNSKIYYLGDEVADILIGNFNCMKFKPRVVTGNVFGEDYPLVVWISDDLNRIPIKVESKIIVGYVRLELVRYKGLMYPLNKN